jgi:hypothetical protein
MALKTRSAASCAGGNRSWPGCRLTSYSRLAARPTTSCPAAQRSTDTRHHYTVSCELNQAASADPRRELAYPWFQARLQRILDHARKKAAENQARLTELAWLWCLRTFARSTSARYSLIEAGGCLL